MADRTKENQKSGEAMKQKFQKGRVINSTKQSREGALSQVRLRGEEPDELSLTEQAMFYRIW